jgi:hypothetical protein
MLVTCRAMPGVMAGPTSCTAQVGGIGLVRAMLLGVPGHSGLGLRTTPGRLERGRGFRPAGWVNGTVGDGLAATVGWWGSCGPTGLAPHCLAGMLPLPRRLRHQVPTRRGRRAGNHPLRARRRARRPAQGRADAIRPPRNPQRRACRVRPQRESTVPGPTTLNSPRQADPRRGHRGCGPRRCRREHGYAAGGNSPTTVGGPVGRGAAVPTRAATGALAGTGTPSSPTKRDERSAVAPVQIRRRPFRRDPRPIHGVGAGSSVRSVGRRPPCARQPRSSVPTRSFLARPSRRLRGRAECRAHQLTRRRLTGLRRCTRPASARVGRPSYGGFSGATPARARAVRSRRRCAAAAPRFQFPMRDGGVHSGLFFDSTPGNGVSPVFGWSDGGGCRGADSRASRTTSSADPASRREGGLPQSRGEVRRLQDSQA